jgi:DNA-binding MarR family transcriptional regulator
MVLGLANVGNYNELWYVGLINVDQANERTRTMSTTSTFGTQSIGQTEKALNAILDRELTGSGLSERQWVALTLTAMTGPAPREQLQARVAGAIKLDQPGAEALMASLVEAGLVEIGEEAPHTARPTPDGAALQARVRGRVTEITARLWGDLPADDLATAGRVLATVLERANEELSRA